MSRLVSKLRYNVTERKNLRVGGPENRHKRLQKIVTGLLRHERLELLYTEGDEARGYVERLISDAIRHGDTHTPTMDMASYWITDKPIIHKLFKVLAPRYKNYDSVSYTKLWRAPRNLPGHGRGKCVLELRNNIYPPLGPDRTKYKNLIHNVLLREAKKFFDNEKELKARLVEKYSALQPNISEKSSARKSSTDAANLETNTETESTETETEVSKIKVEKVDTQENKVETSSFNSLKESSEPQNQKTTNDNENLGIDKMKIKDDELPDKGK